MESALKFNNRSANKSSLDSALADGNEGGTELFVTRLVKVHETAGSISDRKREEDVSVCVRVIEK